MTAFASFGVGKERKQVPRYPIVSCRFVLGAAIYLYGPDRLYR